MAIDSVPLLKVYMPEKAPRALTKVLFGGFVATGSKTDEFEEKFGALINNPNVVATNSCSSALALALYMAGICSGDEVISTPLTCIAVNESILQTGASIIWADIDPDTGNISPESIKTNITEKTKAVVHSHFGGRLANFDAINTVAHENNLKTIEDAASALGGEYKGQPIGNHSDYVAFSFQAVKHITTGDGGMLAVKSGAERNRAILLRNHGNDRHAKRTPLTLGFDVYEAGWKYQMNDIAAVLGLCQLETFHSVKELYHRNLEIYESRLKNISGIQLLKEYPGAISNPLFFTVLAENRNDFIRKLQENNISCSIVHMRNDTLTLFKPFQRESLPNLDYFYERMMNIPLGWWMSEEMVHYVCDIIVEGW